MMVKDVAQYEENDSELAKLTIAELQARIDKAIEFIEFIWNNPQMPTNTIIALRTLDNILQGSDKE